MYFCDAVSLWNTQTNSLTSIEQTALNDCLLFIMGHYRIEKMDQRLLEDYRQRVSRKGISLEVFRSVHIPLLNSILQHMVTCKFLSILPKFFSYRINSLPFSSLAPCWLDLYAKHLTPTTQQRYRSILSNWLMPYWEEKDLSHLDECSITAYHSLYSANGGSDSSFHYHKTILYKVLDYGIATAPGFFITEKPISKVLLKDLAYPWLESIGSQVTTETADAYKTILEKSVIPLLGSSDLRLFNTRRLQDYRAALTRTGYHPATLKKHLTIIYGILHYAVGHGLIPTFPQIDLNYPKADRNMYLPNRKTIERILQLEELGPAVIAIRLAFQLGLTRSEIQSLLWSQVDLVKLTISLKDRTVPIPPDCVYALDVLREEHNDYGCVVRSSRNNSIAAPYLSNIVHSLLTDYGMPEVRLIDLRYDYVIRLLQSHTPEEVTKLAGYKNTETLCRLFSEFMPDIF